MDLSSPFDAPDDEYELLFWQLTNGSISPDDFARLEAQLLQDAALRTRYALYMGVEARLYELHGFGLQAGKIATTDRLADHPTLSGLPENRISTGAGESQSSRPRRRLFAPSFLRLRRSYVWAGTATCLSLLGLFALWPAQRTPSSRGVVSLERRPDEEMVRPPRTPTSRNPLDDSKAERQAEIYFAPASTAAGTPQVAVVTALTQLERGLTGGASRRATPTSRGVAGDAGAVLIGDRLTQGTLSLREGEIHLEFLSGAYVRLTGPAELRLLSANAATLVSGSVVARIPPHARGFVLNTAKAAVVDYGTEFAVKTDAGGRGEVHVLEGEVEVSLLGDDGDTILSERVRQMRTLQVSPEVKALVSLRGPSGDYAPLQPRIATPLTLPDDYAQAVLASDPLLYWRFETLVNGRVLNEAGPQWPARLVDEGETPSITLEQGFARFVTGAAPRYFDVELNNDWPALNRNEYSVELWFNPDYLHWGALFAVSPEMDEPTDRHLTIVELAHATPLMHTPGTVRFLHRYPPRGHGGMNLFAQQGCTPGQWHYVVAIKTQDELRLYVNGALVKTLEQTARSEGRRYTPILGQIKRFNAERQFSGGLDEFALYLRALDEAEIRNRYELATGATKP